MSKKKKPVVLTNQFGLMWIADFEFDKYGELCHTHVLGPAFYDDISVHFLEQELGALHISLGMKYECLSVLKTLPTISALRFFE